MSTSDEALILLFRLAPEVAGNFVQERRDAFAGSRGDGEDRQTLAGEPGGDRLQIFPDNRQVELVEDDNLSFMRQFRVEERQFPVDRLVFPDRIPVRHPGEVEDVEEQVGPLHMPEEAVAQSGALVGALDETGDIGDDEGAVVLVGYHPQVWTRVVKG